LSPIYGVSFLMVVINVNFPRLWLTAALAVGLASLSAAQSGTQYVPNQIIVKFRPAAAGSAGTAHAAINSKVKKTLSQIGTQVINLRAGMTVDQALRYYRGLAGVEYAQPNYIRRAHFTPNDPRYIQQWWLPKVNAPDAWELSIGLSTVKIAILDTGVDYNHQDLKGKVILGRDTVNDDNDPFDDVDHGTHCAGIAAGQTNNGIGIAGLGFNASIIAVKVLGTNGGDDATVSEGMLWAADNGANIISMSLGGPGDGKVTRDAATYCKGKDVFMVASAGNDNTTTRSYPGAIEDIVCVAATDPNDKRAGFSNYGADWVDVAAPGTGIMSTVPNNGYEAFDGTSMACPVVAGLAGLLKSYQPTITAAEIRTIIEANTVPVGTFISKGRVSAQLALNAVVKPIFVDTYVKGASLYKERDTPMGRGFLGASGDLRTADSKTVSIETVYQNGNGYMAAAEITVDFKQVLADVLGSQISITHQSKRQATTTIYLYNVVSKKYEVLKSTPGSDGFTTTTINLPRYLDSYVSNGELKLIVRSYVAARNAASVGTYRLNLDRLVTTARVKPPQ
jgi:thermitase